MTTARLSVMVRSDVNKNEALMQGLVSCQGICPSPPPPGVYCYCVCKAISGAVALSVHLMHGPSHTVLVNRVLVCFE